MAYRPIIQTVANPSQTGHPHLSLGGQAAALIVVQSQAFSTELFPQYPILPAEVLDGIPLLLAKPTGDRDQRESERVESPAHWPRIAANTP
jgi:hypothetical protein